MDKKVTPYMSYWSGGYNGEPSEFIINLHKLSAHYAEKTFGEIHFITDSKSLPFFEKIKFSSISTELDSLDIEYESVWALSKLYVYKLLAEKNIPFIHIDYDVFLMGGLNESFLSSPIFAQSIETNINEFYDIEYFKKNCPNLHDLINPNVNHAYNVGIFGGHDVKFIADYANKAISITLDNDNKDFMINDKNLNNIYWRKSVMLEQYYLAVLLEKYNKNITLLLKGETWDVIKKEAKNKGYIHLLSMKGDGQIINKINDMVKRYKL